MIEYVEDFTSELEIESFGNPRIFRDRKIGVDEIRSNDGVTSQASWMATAGHDWIDLEIWGSGSRADRYIAEGTRDCKRGVRRCRAVGNRRRSALWRSVKGLADAGV